MANSPIKYYEARQPRNRDVQVPVYDGSVSSMPWEGLSIKEGREVYGKWAEGVNSRINKEVKRILYGKKTNS